MLSCRQIADLVTAYVEGEMGLATRIRFATHIAMCGHCRRYVRQMKAVVMALGRVAPEPVDPVTRDALLRHFKDWSN